VLDRRTTLVVSPVRWLRDLRVLAEVGTLLSRVEDIEPESSLGISIKLCERLTIALTILVSVPCEAH
jgi:hypothetical protein